MPTLTNATAATDADPPRVWRQGSLVYGPAALVALFACLLIGDFAWSLKERAVTPVAQILMRQLQAGDLFVAVVVGSFPAALALLLGPVIAVRSDRHRGRLGRRIPFLLLPMPLVVGGLLGMAATLPAGALLHGLLGAASPGERACRMAWFALSWTMFEAASVTANAVFGGLIADVVPARLTGRFYGLFRAVSLLAGIGFTYQVLGHAESHFPAIFTAIAVTYGAGVALMCWRVREGRYPPPAPLPPSDRGLGAVRRYLHECFSNRFYVLLFFAMMLGQVAGNPVNGFGVFYAQHVGLGLDGYGKALALTYACSLLLAFPVGWLADRFHPLRVGLTCVTVYALAMLLAGCWVGNAQQFAWAFVAHGVLSGAYLTGVAALGQYLYPQARFAQFHSAMSLLSAVGYMLVPPAMGAWLDATGNEYRHTFVASGLLAAASAGAFLALLKPFRALGGARHYQAP